MSPRVIDRCAPLFFIEKRGGFVSRGEVKQKKFFQKKKSGKKSIFQKTLRKPPLKKPITSNMTQCSATTKNGTQCSRTCQKTTHGDALVTALIPFCKQHADNDQEGHIKALERLSLPDALVYSQRMAAHAAQNTAYARKRALEEDDAEEEEEDETMEEEEEVLPSPPPRARFAFAPEASPAPEREREPSVFSSTRASTVPCPLGRPTTAVELREMLRSEMGQRGARRICGCISGTKGVANGKCCMARTSSKYGWKTCHHHVDAPFGVHSKRDTLEVQGLDIGAKAKATRAANKEADTVFKAQLQAENQRLQSENAALLKMFERMTVSAAPSSSLTPSKLKKKPLTAY